MSTHLSLNQPQKFVIVETNKGTFIYGDPDVEFHKDIVRKIEDQGILVLNVKGGGKIKVEDNCIYVWGKSSVYGEFSFTEVFQILKNDFPNHRILNQEP